MNTTLNTMTKCLAVMTTAFLVSPSIAHDVAQSARSMSGVAQLVRVHAQKVCAQQGMGDSFRCEGEQIRALAESAASISMLRPAMVSPGEYASMLERAAGTRQSTAEFGVAIDCRINVC